MCSRMKGKKLLQWCVDERQKMLSKTNDYDEKDVAAYERAAYADLREKHYTDAEIDTMKAKMEQAYLTPVEAKENPTGGRSPRLGQ